MKSYFNKRIGECWNVFSQWRQSEAKHYTFLTCNLYFFNDEFKIHHTSFNNVCLSFSSGRFFILNLYKWSDYYYWYKNKLQDYLQNSKNIFFANLTLRHCRRIFDVSQLNVPGNLHLERFLKRSHSEVTKLQKENREGCDFLIFV